MENQPAPYYELAKWLINFNHGGFAKSCDSIELPDLTPGAALFYLHVVSSSTANDLDKELFFGAKFHTSIMHRILRRGKTELSIHNGQYTLSGKTMYQWAGEFVNSKPVVAGCEDLPRCDDDSPVVYSASKDCIWESVARLVSKHYPCTAEALKDKFKRKGPRLIRETPLFASYKEWIERTSTIDNFVLFAVEEKKPDIALIFILFMMEGINFPVYVTDKDEHVAKLYTVTQAPNQPLDRSVGAPCLRVINEHCYVSRNTENDDNLFLHDFAMKLAVTPLQIPNADTNVFNGKIKGFFNDVGQGVRMGANAIHEFLKGIVSKISEFSSVFDFNAFVMLFSSVLNLYASLRAGSHALSFFNVTVVAYAVCNFIKEFAKEIVFEVLFSRVYSAIAAVKEKIFGAPDAADGDQALSGLDIGMYFVHAIWMIVASLLIPQGMAYIGNFARIARAATLATDLTTKMKTFFSELINGRTAHDEFADEFRRYEKSFDEYLAAPQDRWVGDTLVQIQNTIKGYKDAIYTAKGYVDKEILAPISQKCAAVEIRYQSTAMDNASRAVRPVPVCLYLWSEQPGLGKSTYVGALAKWISTRVDTFNPKVYAVPSTSKHMPAYLGEHTVLFDEVGAIRGNDSETDPLIMINNLVSTAAVPTPGASLETKNQVLRPWLVVLCSNYSFDALDKGRLNNASVQALRSRLLEVEVRDPQYNPRVHNARMNQPHRRADFSHLDFFIRGRRLTVNEIQFEVAQALATHRESHARNVAALDEALVDENNIPFVYWVAGLPGTNKSRRHLNIFRRAAQLQNLPFIDSFQGVPRLEDLPTNPCYFAFDDVFDFEEISHQRNLFNIINAVNPRSVVVVVSNYGPRYGWLSPILRQRAVYKPVSFQIPGLSRRCGFERVENACLCVANAKDLRTIMDDTPIRTLDVLCQLTKYWKQTNYLKLVDYSTPPFEPSESDMWIEINGDANVASVIAKVAAHMPVRLMPFLTDVSQYDPNASIQDSVLGIFERIIKKYSDVKIHVRVLNRVFILNGTNASISFAAILAQLNIGASGVSLQTPDGEVLPISEKHVNMVLRSECTSSEETDIKVFYHLTCMRRNSPAQWNALLHSGINYSHSARLVDIKNRFFRGLQVVGEWIGQHPWLSTFIAVILAATAAFSFCSAKSTKLPDLKPTFSINTKCHVCDVDEEACPYMQDQPLGKKGKNKKSRGRKYGKTVIINGVSWKVYDLERTTWGERLLWDLRHHCGRTGYEEQSYTTSGNIGGFKGKFGYDITDEGVKYRLELEDMPLSSDNTLHDNMLFVGGEMGSLYAVMLNSMVGRVNTHLFASGIDEVPIPSHPGYYIKRVYDIKDRDMSYVHIYRNGKRTQLPGFKSITSKLTTAENIHGVTDVIVAAAGSNTLIEKKWTYKEFLSVPALTKTGPITKKVGIVPFASTDWTYLKHGKCGSMVYAMVNSKLTFVGQLSIYRPATHEYIFPVITIQEWNDYVRAVEDQECAGPAVPTTNNMSFPKIVDEQIHPKHFLDQRDFNPVGPTLKQVASCPGNCVPIDCKSKKRPLFNHHFKDLFGIAKYPTMTLDEMRESFPEKIPPDANGNLHPFYTRLQAGDGHRAEIPDDIKQHSIDVIKAYAERDRQDYAIGKFKPLSIEEAIWGCDKIEKMGLNTSTGAMFQTIYPGKSMKSDIFGENRGEFLGQVGEEVKEMIRTQWESYQTNEPEIWPTAISMKAETLPPEKLHRKRLVNVVDPITVVNQRRLFGPVFVKMVEDQKKSQFQMKFDPMSQFHSMATRMGAKPYRTALDMKNFDLTVHPVLFDIAAEYYKILVDAGPTLSKIIDSVFRTIRDTPMLVGKSVIAKSGGVPSGMFPTSWFDTMIMRILFYLSVEDHFIRNGLEYSPEIHAENTDALGCGDDVVACWTDLLNDADYTYQTFVDYVKGWGMVATAPDKDKDVYAMKVEDMSFCSRTFVRLPGYPHLWAGRLKESALSSWLCWTNYPSDVESLPALLEIQNEIALYPDEVHEHFVELVTSLPHKVALRTLRQVRSDLAQRIIAASMPKVNKELKIINRHSFLLPLSKVFPEDQKILNIKLKTEKMVTNNEIFLGCETVSEFLEQFKVREGDFPEQQHIVKLPSGKTIVFPQFQSYTFFKALYDSLFAGTTPQWVETIIHEGFVDPKTKSQRRILHRFRIASAFKLCVTTGNLASLQELIRGDQALINDVPVGDGLHLGEHLPTSRYTIDDFIRFLKTFPSGNAIRAHPFTDEAFHEFHRLANHSNPPWTIDTTEGPKKTYFIGSTGFYFQYAEYMLNYVSHRCWQWWKDVEKINNKDIRHMFAAVLHAFHRHKYTRPCKQYICETIHHYTDMELMDEAPARSMTGQAPNQEPGANKSSSAAVANTIVGAIDNPIPNQTTNESATPLVVTAGPGTTEPLIVPGGIVNQDLISQTGYAQNILTLAGQKIFKKIVRINTGIAEGTLLLNEKVNPWSAALLNPFAKQWADLHHRFFGSLNMHVQLITANTVVGAVKVYYVPKLIEGCKNDQATLDACGTWAEFSLSTAGEAVIPITPTIGNNAVTGIYRSDAAQSFGKVVVLATTDVHNTMNATTNIQLKISLSFAEDTIYDLPTALVKAPVVEDKVNNVDLDILVDSSVTNPRLCVDGRKMGVAPVEPVPSNFICGKFNKHGMIKAFPMIAGGQGPTDNTIVRSGSNSILFTDTKKKDVFKECQSLQVGNCALDADGNFARWEDNPQYLKLVETRAKMGIQYRNVNVGTWDGKDARSDFRPCEFFDVGQPGIDQTDTTYVHYAFPGLTYTFDEDGFVTQDFQWDFTMGKIVARTPGAHGTKKWYYPPAAGKAIPEVRVTGVPIVIKSFDLGATITPSYHRATITDMDNMRPSVVKGLEGITIVDNRHTVKCNLNAMRALRMQSDFSSILTTITAKDGTYVCTVLRNAFGMFIKSEDVPRYATLTWSFDRSAFNETHAYSTQLWPTSRAPVPSFFATRELSSAGFVEGAIGAINYKEYIPEAKFFEMSPQMSQLTLVETPRYGEDQPLIGPIAHVAGAVGLNAISGVTQMTGAKAQAKATKYAAEQSLKAHTIRAKTNLAGVKYQADTARQIASWKLNAAALNNTAAAPMHQ